MRRLLTSIAIVAALVLAGSAASVDGLKIHSAAAGKGQTTLVFVHGWTCDSTSWAAQVPALAKKYRVITLDLPGHGQSGSPADGKFSMDLFARAVESVRAEAKADKIVLIGHSMGAPVIRQYARLYPQHVTALVAVDGPLDMRNFGQPQRGAAAFTPPPVTGPDGLKNRETMIRSMFTPQTPAPLQQQILAMMLRAPEATAAGAMSAMFDPALRTADVAPMPAYAIYAGTARLPNADAMKQALPKYEATQLAGTGHFVMMEKPDEFNRLLTAFVERVSGRNGTR
jgi:pimeloyl-ACP methyl ester carboxylesterase